MDNPIPARSRSRWRKRRPAATVRFVGAPVSRADLHPSLFELLTKDVHMTDVDVRELQESA